ncbi:hypothetical protein GCM10010211_15070 [Streptomyces albospinus]|uniref:Chaplin domain-containing protein n=1 Tax=Streptomyces albospinus TaxID=285515 RepID=A0ABQ2USK1_9ACTN|nr:hypothetical protein GCM10010211_15070 [Streptomyces albospinus]
MIKKVIAASVATGGLLLAGAGTSVADAGADGAAVGSPGVLSGNQIQVPLHVPINACGNTVNVIGALNPAFGNRCANVSKSHERREHKHHKHHKHHRAQEQQPQMHHERSAVHHREAPEAPEAPAVTPETGNHRHHHHVVSHARPQLAKTGGAQTGLAIAGSVGLLAGGTLLYRRGRRAANN